MFKDKQKFLEYQKQYRLKNKIAISERYKKWSLAHKEELKLYRSTIGNKRKKELHDKDRDKYREYCNQYRKSHLEKSREYARKAARKKALSPSGRMERSLRARLWQSLKGKYHSIDIENLLGCSLEFAIHYIESLFLPGMSWNNWGLHGWHVDHIIPCASFDLSDINQRKECFRYTNLRPLWAKDNLTKGSKISFGLGYSVK